MTASRYLTQMSPFNSLIFSFYFQYYYSVRIFAGQEPSGVWIGWVTPDYHLYDPSFDLSKVRCVTVTVGDDKGNIHDRLVRPHFSGILFKRAMPVLLNGKTMYLLFIEYCFKSYATKSSYFIHTLEKLRTNIHGSYSN